MTTTSSQSELLTAVQIYFDALHECDIQKLNAVFHEKSSLFDADNGTIFVEPIDSFSRDVAGRRFKNLASRKSAGYKRRLKHQTLSRSKP